MTINGVASGEISEGRALARLGIPCGSTSVHATHRAARPLEAFPSLMRGRGCSTLSTSACNRNLRGPAVVTVIGRLLQFPVGAVSSGMTALARGRVPHRRYPSNALPAFPFRDS